MRLIKKLTGCIEVIAATAVVATTLFGGVTGKVSVNAAEVTDKPVYYWEDDDTVNKNGVKYVMDKEDSAAFKEYFGYFDDNDSRQMNIFYEDSTLRIDADKSAYGIDAAKEVDVYAYELSRDESGKLVFDRKAVCLLGEGVIGGGFVGAFEVMPISFKGFSGEKEYKKAQFTNLYNSKSDDGKFQAVLRRNSYNIDFIYINLKYEASDGEERNNNVIMMPDYMIDKTVLHLTKVTDDKTDDVTDNTYTYDATDKDTQIVDNETFTKLLKENENKDIVIKSNNNVTFTFAKGTMKSVDGKNEYDFSTTINPAYADTMPSYVTKDNFVSQVKFNYSGQLPATASIRIPVGTQYAGTTLYYSLMKADGTFAGTQAVVVDEEGYMTVKQNHCSEYVITKEAPALINDKEASTSEDKEATVNDQGTDASLSELTETPATSDGYSVYVYMSCIIMALAGAVIYRTAKRA
jgi:hypothetical protein